MFKYNEFREFVKGDGLSKQNRFYLIISMPAISGQTGSNFSAAGPKSRDLHMLCKSISVPGVNVASSPTRYTGETMESPYDRTFGDAQIGFYVDRQMYVRQFFDDWVNLIQDQKTKTFNYYKDFISNEVSIFVLDKEDKETYQITLYEAFPKSIGQLSLEQSDNSTMVFDVTLSFKYYTTRVIERDIGTAAPAEGSPLGEWTKYQAQSFVRPSLNPINVLRGSTYQQALQTYTNNFVDYQNTAASFGIDNGSFTPLSNITTAVPNTSSLLSTLSVQGSPINNVTGVLNNINGAVSSLGTIGNVASDISNASRLVQSAYNTALSTSIPSTNIMASVNLSQIPNFGTLVNTANQVTSAVKSVEQTFKLFGI